MSIARVRPSLSVEGGYIYASGGYNDNHDVILTSTERYNPKTDEWVCCESPLAHPSFDTMVYVMQEEVDLFDDLLEKEAAAPTPTTTA